MNLEYQSKINTKINIDNAFINAINNAIDKLASDIHIEPNYENYQIRIRVHGELIESTNISKIKIQNIISQLKILAKLDITESRIPQDGKIDYFYDNNQYNLRLSTCPTILGEKLVIRILQNRKKLLNISELGLNKIEIDILKNSLSQNSGLILFTGATGSGKTTSLYACINELDFKKHNIISIEDPVEITFPEINQININPKIDLTFTKILKAVLRQDPDIIIIGEIRDLETAKIAISAAQTGHLVLATMHSNNATNAINRLLELGLPNYILNSCINLIIHQQFLKQDYTKENLKNNVREPIFELKKLCL